ncbi:hypothetical protein GCM10028824_06360 [Hymenobacter segetis]|uniref:Uncharacterized protein n=1 Tax=Hymenobacter segetis TaxID=2025509 RepID=A0ABU9M0H2_9BACT
MGSKLIINQLKLAYSPLSNRDFALLKDDTDIQANLINSNLYAICQRPELYFSNLNYYSEDGMIDLEIRQENNPNILRVLVPLFQECFNIDPSKYVLISAGAHNPKSNLGEMPMNYVAGFKIYEGEDEKTLGKFIVWFTPEKLLQNIWNGGIIADIEGNIRNFTKYQVLYVGKATDQRVWQRLSGHDALQNILSLEEPIVFGSLPTHEIAILFFAFKENTHIQSFGAKSGSKEFVDLMMGYSLPSQKSIFLDAEKALINAMLPKYNKELFKSYPKSKDGLYSNSYDYIRYTFTDPISLIYSLGEIRGGLNAFGGDKIIIEQNKTMKLIKAD